MTKVKPYGIVLILVLLIGLLGLLNDRLRIGSLPQSQTVQAQSGSSGQGYNIYLPSITTKQGSGGVLQPSSPFMFVAWGDTKTGTSVLASLSGQVKALNPPFTVYAGDLEESGFTTNGMNAWTQALNGNSANGMSAKTFSLRGNHDAANTAGWQTYFDTQSMATRIGATHFSSLSSDLTYAFDYGNAFFIVLDVPGDASLVTAAQIAYLDSGLASAKTRGLTHAFVFLHGPIYPVGSHTSCAARTCSTPTSLRSLIAVLNKHTIVSAVFNGHEHMQAYVHMDSSRVPEITHPFEQFITGSAGAGLNACNKTFRFDNCGSYNGFATVSVAGNGFTVAIYKENQTTPEKTFTFNKQ